MFLRQLEKEDGKKFLELAYIAMNVDNVQHDNEKKLIDLYAHELNLDGYRFQNDSYDELLKYFAQKSMQIKGIIVFELLGILCCDGELLSVEKEWICRVATKLGVDDKFLKDVQVIVEGLISWAAKAGLLINSLH